MHVVVTAGHVDHGKSTLVRALTGQEPDRLEEERRRGLSIQLGYCWTRLPGAGEVAFVDAPGHEKFIATTLSGMGPVPVAMLVVAADDPWMPQAAEHLAALDALGVRHGLLVVTRSDLADPAPALERARAEVDRTSLRGVPALTVSGRTGEGLEELRDRLASVLQEVPPPDPAADPRLWVDRRFHAHGTGTVVTGTLPAGTLAVGDVLAHDGRTLRVKTLQSLGQERTSVTGTARVAVVVSGRVPPDLGRGSALVAPGRFEPTAVVDVRVDAADELPERPLLHLGSTSQAVRARPLGSEHARLHLASPLPLRVGDRGLLRDPGSRRVWGVRVADPLPAPLDRRGAAVARAKDLAGLYPTLAGHVALRGTTRRSLLDRLGLVGSPAPGTLAAGDWLVSPERASALRERLRELVDRSEGGGVLLTTVARSLDLEHPDLVAALVRAPLVLDRGRVRAATTLPVPLPDRLREGLEKVRSMLVEAPFAAPDAAQLRELGLDDHALAVLHRRGDLLRLADGVVLLPGADDLAVRQLAVLPQPFAVSAARQALGTSRRVVLPLLSLLDRTGRTVRLADDTRRLRALSKTSGES